MKTNTKNMRSAALIALGILLTSGVFAQKKGADYGPDSASCVANLSVYYEFYKQKNYTDAYKPWQKALQLCPASKKSLYIYGAVIMEYRIKRETDPALKEALEDSLFMLYDMRIEHFGQKCYVLGQKAAKMYKYDSEEPALAHALYGESMECMKEKSTASTLSGFYQSLYDMYQKDGSLKEQLVNDYVLVADHIDKNIKELQTAIDAGEDTKGKLAKELEGYMMAKSNVNEIFYKVADCEALNTVVSKVMETADPDDLDIRKRLLNILNKKDCTDSDLYLEIAKSICEVEPNDGCMYSIAIQHLKKQEYSSAYQNFKGAVELCGDCEDLDKYLLRAGQAASLTGQHQTAYNYGQKLLARDPNNGEAYLLMGDALIGARNTCGDKDLDVWGIYWSATDKYERAKAVDSSVAGKAASKIANCKSHYPAKDKLFFYSMKEGDAYEVGCWLNHRTTARTQ